MKEFLVNERMREIRINLGLSQGELGSLIDIWPQNISAWENGTRKPGILACYRIMELAEKYGLHIPLEYLRPDLASRK